MLWAIVVVLLVCWALGFALNLGGGLIHILLALALIVVVYNFVVSRQSP